MPTWAVAWPCGSRSTSSTSCPVAESAAARFTAVVVLPTPPFWFTTAIDRGFMSTLLRSRAPYVPRRSLSTLGRVCRVGGERGDARGAGGGVGVDGDFAAVDGGDALGGEDLGR